MDFMFAAIKENDPQLITSTNLAKMIRVVANNMFNNQSAMYTLPIFEGKQDFEVVKVGKHGAKIRFGEQYGYISYSLLFPTSYVKCIEGDRQDVED